MSRPPRTWGGARGTTTNQTPRTGGRRRRAKRIRGRRRRRLTRLPAVILDFVNRRVVEFTDGNQLDLFDNGVEGLAAMLDEIERAQHCVHLETYILRSDDTGLRFLAALTERSQAGVQVRLIYDSLGSRALDRMALDPLLRAGGLANEFNPLGQSIRARMIRRRDHRKLLIIDGRVGFIGGLNIGDEYAAGVDGTPTWRDAHARVEGPVVGELDRRFAEMWTRCETGSPFDDEMSPADETASASSGAGHTIDAARRTRAAVLADGPIYRRRRMRDTVISGLDEARSRVLLVSPYFAPGRSVLDSLMQAASRGVEVEVLMAGRSDHPIFRRAARTFIPRLLASGVRVFEDSERMMHAKVAAFDDQLSIIGTSNLDRQSLHHSYEVSLLVEGRETAAWIRRRFGPGRTGARPIEIDALAKRGWLARLIDYAAWTLVRI